MAQGAQSDRQAWENSYTQGENFVFSPHEEVVRFIARYIRRRVGLHEFEDRRTFSRIPRLLDLGCGIGRHVIYAHQMGLEAYGIDHSATALAVAVRWGAEHGLEPRRFQQGDLRELPWPDGFFDCIVSHGVLDSMPFADARAAIPEAARVLTPGGLFYCDLLARNTRRQAADFAGEEVVAEGFEQGTVASYFTLQKAGQLIEGYFAVEDGVLVTRSELQAPHHIARYHLVLRRQDS